MKLTTLLKLIKEEISASEAYRDESAIQTVIDGKRNVGFQTIIGSTAYNSLDDFLEVVRKNNLKVLKVNGNKHQAYVYYRPGSKKQAMELKKIAEKYGGYLAYSATEEDTRRIGELLGYKKSDIDSYVK
jgi:hypothetical protein